MSNHLFNTINSIIGLLFDREEAHLAKREKAMINKNSMLGGSTDGFRYMGRNYTDLAGAARTRGKFTLLHTSLIDEMKTLDEERELLAVDKNRIQQALALVLKEAHSFQDMRDALPNGVAELIPEFRSLQRTREEAFTLADNPRSYTQYMKLREKIDFYVAARMLY